MGTPTGKPSLHRPSCPPDGCTCWDYPPPHGCGASSSPAVTSASLPWVTPALGPAFCAPISNVPSVPQVTSPWAPVSFAPVSQGAPRS